MGSSKKLYLFPKGVTLYQRHMHYSIQRHKTVTFPKAHRTLAATHSVFEYEGSIVCEKHF